MFPPTKAAYNQLQVINYTRPTEQRLPKNIIKLIGLYADDLNPAETYLELKSLLEEKVFGYRYRVTSEKQTGIKYYHLTREGRDETPAHVLAWEYLSGALDDHGSPRDPDQFKENLNRVFDYVFFPWISGGRNALHILIEKNNLGLIKVFLKRRDELLKPLAPSTNPRSVYCHYKSTIDARTMDEVYRVSFESAVQYAASVGNLRAFDLLVAAGADIARGIHPLMFAVHRNQFDFVKTVLERQESGYLLLKESLVTLIPYNINNNDGLLLTGLSILSDPDFEPAASQEIAYNKMLAFLIEKGSKVRDYSHDEIQYIVSYRFKEATIALVRSLGIDKLLGIPNLYRLIDLVGGYDKVRELTNTEVTDPKMLTLIFLGIYSQALSSMFITRYSLNIFKHIFDQISPIDPQACERNKGLMVTELQRWYANKPILSPFDPNPMAHMTRGQKSAWGLR
jgi:hypothetical protein